MAYFQSTMKAENQPNPASQSKHEEALRANLKGLIPLAEKAYSDKRRKDCLALTTAILKIDPSNPDARRFQSLIQSDIEQALQQVEGLIHDPLWDKEEVLRRNANRLLQSVLDIDPRNREAESILEKINPVASRPTASAPRRDPFVGRGVEHNFPQLEPADWDDSPPPHPWVRPLLFVIPALLILLALLIHYW